MVCRLLFDKSSAGMSDSVRILIVDDHEAIRRGVRSLLSARPDFHSCGEAVDGIDAIEKTRDLRPDVVLMDISMPRMDGLEATRTILSEHPRTKVIIVSQNEPAIARRQAAEVAASGYVSKSDLDRDLLSTIEKAVDGEVGRPHNSPDGAEKMAMARKGGGAMGNLIRSTDWSKTPLGPAESWSPALRMMVNFLLANRFPQLLWWGPQFCCLYNDAYTPILGVKHPWAIGKPVSEVWHEIWHVLKPLIETPFRGGEATWVEDIPLEIDRRGFVEETHFTVAYSPVPDDAVESGIGGVLATVHEITEKVIGERRIVALSELGAASAEPKTAEEACANAARILCNHSKDVPFVLLYLFDPKERTARLAGSAGVEPHDIQDLKDMEGLSRRAPGQIWPVAESVEAEKILLIEDLHNLFRTPPQGPWSDPSTTAAVVPLRSHIPHRLAGFMIVGISPRLQFDESYRKFLDLMSTQVSTTVGIARAYEEEKNRAEALAEIDRAKTAFFSNLSHEFRTPLTLMLAPLQDILTKPESEVHPENRQILKVVRRNGLRLQKMVNALLDFSRIEAGRVQPTFQPIDLAILTSDLASSFRSATERAGLEFKVQCEPTSQVVYVDREMWEKIVLNLLSNAFKFTFKGGIEIRLHSDSKNAILTVRDTGVGITKEELPKLFERFHRIEGSRARTHEGSGIGLALVQELIKIHGGEITASSEFGKGTMFQVTVPFGSAHLASDRVRRTTASNATSPTHTGVFVDEALGWLPGDENILMSPDESESPKRDPNIRILLADDNSDMREYIARLLGARWSVETESDGVSALEAVRRDPPTLVITDIMMPRLDGFGLLSELRKDPKTRSIPVIMLSARAGEESRLEGLEAGADDYIVKPFTARELIARVAARLDVHRLGTLLEKERSAIDDLFRQTPVPIAVMSGWDLVYTIANPAYQEVVGKRDIVGKPILEALPELKGQGFDDLARTVMRTGNAYIGREALVKLDRHGTGVIEDTYFTFIYSPLGGQTGPNHSVIAICSEVTDHVRARKQLEILATEASAEKEKFQKLSESLDAEVRARTRELEERNAEVLNQSAQLRDLSWRLLRTQDEQRRHIARELHDSAGQTLTVLGMSIAQLVQKSARSAPNLATDAESIQETVQQLHREIRTASYLLHPPLLDENGLSSAISYYIQGLVDRSGLDISLDISENLGRLPEDMELAIFRLVQECLTNIHRHSGSKTASISIARMEDVVSVRVQDQGKGMPPARLAEILSQGSGVGIRGMRERLRQFDGTVEIESDSSGTRIFATIPIPAVGLSVQRSGLEPLRASR